MSGFWVLGATLLCLFRNDQKLAKAQSFPTLTGWTAYPFERSASCAGQTRLVGCGSLNDGELLESTSRFNSNAVGIGSGVAASLFWAAGFVGVRHGLDVGFSPFDLIIHRFLWSGLAFLPFVIRGGIRDLNGIGWGRGILLTVLGGPVFAIVSYSGFMLAPLGHGGVIQPSCATLGGLLLAALLLRERLTAMRTAGALLIVCGVVVIGVESVTAIGLHSVAGDLIFVLTGLMFASFGTLLRLWRIPAMPVTMVISVLALSAVAVHWTLGGFDHMIELGWRENLLQAVLQGVLAGPAAIYLFVRSIQLLGAARAAVFPSLVPPFVLLIAWLALGEAPSGLQLAGLVIALFGFRLAQSTSRWSLRRAFASRTSRPH
jgi:drug/metabolite transporter (DMT)-like permease